jgi:hypothetical protein
MMANLAQALGDALGALVGGGGSSAPYGQLFEGVGAAVADVARALGDTLGALVGGDGTTHPLSGPVAQPLLALHGFPERASELLQGAGDAVTNLAQATGGLLGGGGEPHQAHKPIPAPAAPAPAAPPPVAPPLLPAPVAPGGYSSSSVLVGSGSAGDAFHLLFAVLAVFSVALLQGGRLSWLRRESHGPPTAFTLAIERPG